MKTTTFLAVLFVGFNINAAPDWTANFQVPPGGRPNINDLNSTDFKAYQTAGKIHAQIYPVTVTGILVPYEPMMNLIESDSSNPLRQIIDKSIAGFTGIKNLDTVLAKVGMHPYPKVEDKGVYQVPYPNGVRPEHRMGFGLMERDGAKGLIFSCAACHSANLFGKTVLGMTNRFPSANNFFVKSKILIPVVDKWLFKVATNATNAEVDMFDSIKTNIQRVGAKDPLVLGLDTSLAQVALSLNHRKVDEYATPSDWFELFPRRDPILDDEPADSKPAVWWNLKYKNRWLSDGSILSGNPIFTNFIWNEIGRGADLHQVEAWLADNQKIVDELTTAVFSTEPPRFTDFFPAEKIDLMLAKKGEKIFVQNCAKCHGNYDKAWNLPNADQLTAVQKLETILVRPKALTPVKDVGTDAYRRKGMKSLEVLNELSISQRNKIIVQEQEGYVPPPLVGIWARWPYLHNNSIPSLCALLAPGPQRPVVYYAGEANNPETDFDADCNGYPLGDKTPNAWKQSEFRYNTKRRGMGNMGHDENIFIKDGKEILTVDDKKSLIKFLQTL